MRGWAIAILAALIAVAATYRSLEHDFVYDDHRFVVGNPAVQEGVSAKEALLDAKTLSAESGVGGAYRPLRTWIWARIAPEGKPTPAPYRWPNLLLHGLCVFLLARLGSALEIHDAAIAAAALLFACHPLALEAVVWISSLGDLLAACGYFATLLWFLKRLPSGISSVGILLATFLALLGKEMAATLPLALLLVSFFEGQGGWKARRWEIAASALALGMYLGLRAQVLKEAGFAQNDTPITSALWDMGQGLSYYLGAFFLLVAPRFDWTWETTRPALALFGWLAWLAALILPWWFGRPGRGELRALSTKGGLFMLAALALLPVLQFIPLNIIAADRFFYPSAAFLSLALFGLAFSRLSPRGLAVVLALLLVIGAALRQQLTMPNWCDDRSLWEATVERNGGLETPAAQRARYNLGRAILGELRRGEYDDAASTTAARRAHDLVSETWAPHFGGRAVATQAALFSNRPIEVIELGGAVFDDWLQGKPDAEGNIDAVIAMMHRAAALLGQRAGANHPQGEFRRAAVALGRPPAFLAQMRSRGAVGEKRLAEFLKIRGFLMNLAGRHLVALEDFRLVLDDLQIDDLDVRVWRLGILSQRAGPEQKDFILEEYRRLMERLPIPEDRKRFRLQREAFLSRLDREAEARQEDER